jgi:hypothetical protein
MQKWEYITLELFIDAPDIDFEVGQDAVAQKMAPAKPRWADNKDDERPVAERLNELGQEGWELVSSYSPTSAVHIYILKRPIE